MINTTILASSWYSCAVVIDRVIAIKNSRLSDLVNAKTTSIISSICILSFLFHLPRFLEFDPDEETIKKGNINGISKGAKPTSLFLIKRYQIFAYLINTSVTTLIPFFVITFFGIWLLKSLIGLIKSQDQLHRADKITKSKSRKDKISLATKLVLVSIAIFTIIGILSFTLFVVTLVDPRFITDPSINPIFHFLMDLNNLLVSLRGSINFLFYCMTCSQYREDLGNMFCPVWSRRTNNNELLNHRNIKLLRISRTDLEDVNVICESSTQPVRQS